MPSDEFHPCHLIRCPVCDEKLTLAHDHDFLKICVCLKCGVSLTVRDNLLAVPDGAAEEIYGAAEREGAIGVAKALRTAIEEALTAAAEADVELEPDEAPDDGEAAV